MSQRSDELPGGTACAASSCEPSCASTSARDAAAGDGLFPPARRWSTTARRGCWWRTSPSAVSARRWRGPGARAPTALHVLAERATGLLARRAAAFTVPIDGVARRRAPVAPGRGRAVAPAAGAVTRAPRAGRRVIEAGGAVPVVEHGVVTGEVRGLEVCRVVDDPFTGAVRLEVGVGAHDREAFAIMHGDVPTVDALRRRRRRRRACTAGPARSSIRSAGWCPSGCCAGRWPPTPRPSVWSTWCRRHRRSPVRTSRTGFPARRSATEATAAPVVVVCSVGVDLDVVPYATDARLAASERGDAPGVGHGEVEVIVAAPARDLVAITAELAGLARHAGPARRRCSSGFGRLGRLGRLGGLDGGRLGGRGVDGDLALLGRAAAATVTVRRPWT